MNNPLRAFIVTLPVAIIASMLNVGIYVLFAVQIFGMIFLWAEMRDIIEGENKMEDRQKSIREIGINWICPLCEQRLQDHTLDDLNNHVIRLRTFVETMDNHS